MKNISFLLLMITSFSGIAQEIVNSIPVDFKRNKAVFQSVDELNNQTPLFLSDKYSVKAIKLDHAMQIIDSVSTARPDSDYDSMIGSCSNKNNTQVFWASSNFEKIYAQQFDFENHAVTGQNYEIVLDDEKLIQTFSANGRFYLLSIVKKSSRLKFYIFDSFGKLEERAVQFSGKFFNSNYVATDLWGVMGENFLPFEAPYSLQQIISTNPVSLSESAKKRKCYIDQDDLTITFDANRRYTQVIKIDLKKFTFSEKVIQMPYMTENISEPANSNSFYIDGNLFQFKVSADNMVLALTDENGALLKEHRLSESQPINFKNSEILQENGDPESVRILERTSQFLRKSNNQNTGISVGNLNGKFLVTLGSVSEVRDNSTVYAAMFGAAGVLISYAFSNSTTNSFNSYKNRKVVSINCLFDRNGEHVEGNLKPSGFDNMRTFLSNLPISASQTVFKAGAFYYLGYYNGKDKQYLIRKFNE